eukprot:2800869-Pyramimonas_sp.AAC.1
MTPAMLGKKSMLDSWRRTSVVPLFNKGETALPSNYRPISLLAVVYNILASMMHHRLLGGDAESRMRGSQFGFRPNNDGGMLLVMLDWAKAFDRLRAKLHV